MPNMSYCAFENTLSDMRQILEMMREAGTVNDLNMNEYEQAAFAQLFGTANEILEEVDRLQETAESVSE
jgi:hypothetical protein